MDDTPPPVPEAAPDKTLPAWVRYVVLTTIFLGLIVALQLAAEQRASAVQEAAFARAVDATAGALAQQLLLRDGSLQTSVQRVAEQGKFDSVTLTDSDGRVVATTDRTRDGLVLKDHVTAPLQAKASRLDGRLRAVRAVVLAGDTRLGALEVVARP